MMRVQIASDLHHELEHGHQAIRALPQSSSTDLVILAGDVHAGLSAIGVYGGYGVPVVYVHGNHELYGQRYPSLIARMEQACEGTSIVFLQNREARFGNVRMFTLLLITG
jgi:predicted phosphodiesterase